MSHRNPGIAELDKLSEALPEGTKALLHRIFSITFTSGVCQPTEAMSPWIERQFGSVEAVCQQRVIKITNLVTFEGAIFNPLAFNKEKVVDYLDTAWRWAQRAHEYDPSAKYFFFVWNSLKKAGASIISSDPFEVAHELKTVLIAAH